ncbi:von Willebrand factor A domain-containing protein 1 [Zonotrichia leucophrys gambelii]|uniref:von Willebrand factor A domain-containing protein 1 n=1 Tax=Zonotrichia leucophrys gambelii TaxID=257770 RepID=UPI0031409EF9
MALKGVGGRKEREFPARARARSAAKASPELQDGSGGCRTRAMTELGLCWAPSGGFKALWAAPGSAMLAKVVFSLLLWLNFAAGQDTPEPAPQPSASNTEGDLLFLLDSSASVSRYEFSKVKEFMWDLLQPFAFGPRDVQASIIHISTAPSMEFPFDRHLSGAGLRGAIAATRQRMGDTNTGKALALAKEKLFSSQAGARPDVPKVLVWVTDGFSTDDISEPMQLLKDMGVTVFIVSTGRGNFLQLSAAASAPSEAHLHFVDVDDLPIITPELRDAIRDAIRANRLHATDVTSSSFRLVWPQLLAQDSGFYSLEYGPGSDPAARRALQVPGARSSLVLTQLAPATTYEVALTPESNVHYFPPQRTRVTTLPEEISPVQVLISDCGPRSLQVSWAPVLDTVASYQVLYGPLPGGSARLLQVGGGHNSTVLEQLAPNTTYLVTVTAIYRSGTEKSLSAKACTLQATEAQGSRPREQHRPQ